MITDNVADEIAREVAGEEADEIAGEDENCFWQKMKGNRIIDF